MHTLSYWHVFKGRKSIPNNVNFSIDFNGEKGEQEVGVTATAVSSYGGGLHIVSDILCYYPRRPSLLSSITLNLGIDTCLGSGKMWGDYGTAILNFGVTECKKVTNHHKSQPTRAIELKLGIETHLTPSYKLLEISMIDIHRSFGLVTYIYICIYIFCRYFPICYEEVPQVK